LSLNTIREAEGFLAKYFRADADDSCSIPQQGRRQECLFEAGDGLADGIVQSARGVLGAGAENEAGTDTGSCGLQHGDHGAAVAFAAKQFGIAARIFLPANCNPVKRGRIAGLGAAIVESGDGDLASAFTLAAQYAKQPGVHFLNDATDEDLPAGPATIGCENSGTASGD